MIVLPYTLAETQGQNVKDHNFLKLGKKTGSNVKENNSPLTKRLAVDSVPSANTTVYSSSSSPTTSMMVRVCLPPSTAARYLPLVVMVLPARRHSAFSPFFETSQVNVAVEGSWSTVWSSRGIRKLIGSTVKGGRAQLKWAYSSGELFVLIILVYMILNIYASPRVDPRFQKSNFLCFLPH